MGERSQWLDIEVASDPEMEPRECVRLGLAMAEAVSTGKKSGGPFASCRSVAGGL